MKDKELIRALRCTATEGSKCIGKECRYYKEEKLPKHLWPLNGEKEYFPSCDVDRIGIDAADRLEELLEVAHGQN